MAKGIKQASKKAQREAMLSQLDALGENKSDFDKANLSIIEEIASSFIEQIKSNIESEGMNVTGNINEIEIQVQDNRVNIYAPNYLIYQDRGVSGTEVKYDTPHAFTDKAPPSIVFSNWIKTKNIQLRNNETYYGKPSPFKDLTEEEQIEQASWAMAKSVQKKGLKPRNIYSKEIPQLIDDLSNELGYFAIQQIVQNIDVKDSAKRVVIKP